MSEAILVTGAAGYIGSHTTLLLLQRGIDVVALDNYANASPESLRRVAELAGHNGGRLSVIEGDVRDRAALDALFSSHRIGGVIHFAGLKAVGASVAEPLRYYENNVGGSIALLDACRKAGTRRFVFSSSATVYGDPLTVPITEDEPLKPVNPYGHSKLMVEQLLASLAASDASWRIATLRYFNPAGAHESGRIGEDPRGVPNNLMPFVAQVAVGKREKLSVFGGDWPTPDGTGVRDYIHVMDLAEAHLAALDRLAQHEGSFTVNVGTGRGTSVLELVQAFAAASGRNVPHEITGRRAGDIAECYADPSRAENLLGWKASRSLAQMCEDGWRWQSQNPEGYEG